jgi:hypothetical protein
VQYVRAWFGTSIRRRILSAAALVALSGLGSSALAQGVNSINPRLDCTWLNADGWWISVWRYKNPGPQVTIPVGGVPPNDNYFVGSIPIGQDQGQFTTFLANQTPQSTEFFTVTMPPTVNSITWKLSGNSVSATKPAAGASTCSSQPVPITGSVPLWIGYGLSAAVMGFLVYRRRRYLPARGGR